MIKNYLALTIRNLRSNKGYFFINLLGLTIGISSFILIILWIKAETSYDKFHANAGNIYRVDYLLYEEGILEQHSASGSGAVGKEIKNAFPEVIDYTRFSRTESLVKYGDKIFKEKKILYAQSSFFTVFSFPIVSGNPDSSILTVNHAVLTEETARKYFGDEDPIGKMITVDGVSDFEVAGVARSIPGNSHFKFDILLSYENLIRNSRSWDNSWVSERVYSYILLTPGADPGELESKLAQLPEKFIGKFMKEAFFLLEYRLVKLTDIHLHSSISNELDVNGNYKNVVTLGIVALLVLIISGSVITGLLPSVYISKFPPNLVLKGKNPTGAVWIGRLKNYLVVFQFTVSIVLIIATITLYLQVSFMRNHDLGFNKEGLVVLDGPRITTAKTFESYMSNFESFRNEIMALSAVSGITGSSSVPGTEIKNSRVFGIPVEGRNTEKRIDVYYIDNYFFDVYGMNLLAGENFAESIKEETNKLIINEAALDYYDFRDPVSTVSKNLRGGNQLVNIKAVIKDFNQQSLKELPKPVAFIFQPANVFYTIKVSLTSVEKVIPALEKIWYSHYPGNPFNYFFLDDFYDEQYNADKRFSKIFLVSSLLAIFIACLGLLGLSAYAISKRTKEIGIRKTNGAETVQVLFLLNVDFLKWVLVAIILAVPVAWYVMNRWLENYAYRIQLSWWIFTLAAIIAVVIAMITVSWQSWRAATRNPVEALRYE